MTSKNSVMNDNAANIIDRAVIEPDEFYESGYAIVQERCGKCKLYHERIEGHKLTSFCPHCGARFIREKKGGKNGNYYVSRCRNENP